MRDITNIFIINPAAGKKRRACAIIPEIHEYFNNIGGKYEIFKTCKKGDATEYVKKRCEQRNGSSEQLRFYSCGGDGTLMEVVNGAFNQDECEVACIPCGSANDYIRNFGDEDLFRNIAKQVSGKAISVDAISCNGLISLNICAIGMDADVAEKMIYFKHFPLVSGTMAYSLAVLYMFFHKIGRKMSITIESEDGTTIKTSGNYLFSLAANGQYYGGGRRSAPQAVYNDGILDFELIDAIGHTSVLGFLGKYNKGKHLDMDIVHTYRGKKMTATSNIPLTIVVDGECTKAEIAVFEIIPAGMQFVVPDRV